MKVIFYQQVQHHMNLLNLTEEDIMSRSNTTLAKMIHDSVKKEALDFLLGKAIGHSKVKHEMYTDLKGSVYFCDQRFTAQRAKLLFKFRTRMFNVRNNFRNKYSCTMCPLCGLVEDSQEHLFDCKIILKYHTPSTHPKELYSSDAGTLLAVAKDLERLVKVREELCPSQ